MKVLSFGEILWDVYAHEKHIGGAPLNFAAHFAKQGGQSYMLSAVGNDDLGKAALMLIKDFGIRTDYVSVLETEQTGKCVVTLDQKGVPHYNLLDNVAYDRITKPDLSGVEFDAFYFGSLAIRNAHNRETVSDIIADNSFKEIFVDINIRPPFVSEQAVKMAFDNATVVKISDEELTTVTKLLFNEEYGYKDAAKVIAEKFSNIKIVIITLGAKGSFAYDCKKALSYSCGAGEVEVISTVGAGDSFSATFLNKYLSGEGIDGCLKAAAKVSAFVVSRVEAIPDYKDLT